MGMDEFDELLLKTIDRTIRYVLGDRNTLIIYEYLEESSCPRQEIPRKLDLFSQKLRNLVGTSRGQMLGAPTILEDAIVKALSSELGLTPENGPTVFEERIRRLKERYNKKMKHAFPETSNRVKGYETVLTTPEYGDEKNHYE
jgi:hypothetical protein